MLSLVGELARARKEVDFTSARIQDLEVALKKEKHAREAAEDRAAQLEIATQRIREQPVCEYKEPRLRFESAEEDHTVTIDAAAHAATALHARMEEILVELKTVKSEMRAYKLRAEAAELRAENVEKERDSNQKTLAETIQSIRKEEDDRQRRRTEQATQTETVDTTDTATQAASDGGRRASAPAASQIKRADSGFKVAALSKEHSLLLRKQASVPYASMLGVVLIGVGLMAVINNWQRGER